MKNNPLFRTVEARLERTKYSQVDQSSRNGARRLSGDDKRKIPLAGGETQTEKAGERERKRERERQRREAEPPRTILLSTTTTKATKVLSGCGTK